MRVLHVIKATRVSGAESHLLTLLVGLRARQINAQIVVLVEPDHPMDDYAERLTACGIPVQRVPIYSDANIGLIHRLQQTFQNIHPDVVHTHLLHADLYGIPAARLAGVPVVISSRHNDDAFRQRLPIKLLNRGLWPLTTAAVAISDYLAQFTVEVDGAPAHKVRRIYYGLDTAAQPLPRSTARQALVNELNLPPNSLLVGMVCRLVEQKGVNDAIATFERLAADFPQTYLLIAGDGPLHATLTAQAAPLGERVRFLGWRSDINSLLAALDVLLAPSLWEGFGLSILEAMAQQIPVVATTVSAIPEVVADGETGLLVPPHDVPALAAALTTLLGDEPLRLHLGLLGRDRLETYFSAARMADETAALYQELLAGKRS